MSWELSLEELAIATHAKILSEFKNKFTGVGTDTRKSLRGQIFFALKGENFDAHDFLEVAVLQGASVLVVSQLPEKAKLLLKKVSIVEVPDVMRAMQNLALFWRHSMSAKIIVVPAVDRNVSGDGARELLHQDAQLHRRRETQGAVRVCHPGATRHDESRRAYQYSAGTTH